MRSKFRLCIAGIALLCLSVNAQERISGPSPSSRATLDLYPEPGATVAARQVAVSELSFPLASLERKASHHRIDFQGQTFWIKGAHVNLAKGSSAGCVPTVKGSVLTASTPGAIKDGCQ